MVKAYFWAYLSGIPKEAGTPPNAAIDSSIPEPFGEWIGLQENNKEKLLAEHF